MINFRFHIVSLTAVFLAFAVGLVLGTTFLDDATERTLNRQLDNLQEDLSSARNRNAEQQAQIERFAEENAALYTPLADRLLPGTLTDVPVLVIATAGLENDPVQAVVESLGQAGADYVGSWVLTDRLLLDDADEVEDLATALDIQTDDVERLQRALSGDLSTVLFHAINTSESEQATADGEAPAAPLEPSLLTSLRDQGFVDYQLPEGSDSDVVQLPASGLRVVVVTGAGADVPSDQVLLPTLTDLVSDGPAPVLVAARTPTEEDDEDNDDGVSRLVANVRDEQTLSERISTVDDLELVSGRLSTMLGLQRLDPDNPVIGHYGLGPGAQDLLPPVS